MMFLDNYGWPVQRIKGRWFVNFIRLLLYTRKIKRGTWSRAPDKPDPFTQTGGDNGTG